MRAYLSADELRRMASRFLPTEAKTRAIGFYLHQQVKDRFATHGASSGVPWHAPKWREAVGHPDGRALLTGRTGAILKNFRSYGTQDEAGVINDAVQANVMQQGTVGAGGVLPDIVPRQKKMLFVPLSDRAERDGWREGMIQGHYDEHGEIRPTNADYILASRSRIPPRPMLPDSDREQSAQVAFIGKTLAQDDETK